MPAADHPPGDLGWLLERCDEAVTWMLARVRAGTFRVRGGAWVRQVFEMDVAPPGRKLV